MDFSDKTILLIISGGIAAYKSLELIRLLKKAGASVRAILTEGGQQFITPLSVSALCEEECHTDLWSYEDRQEASRAESPYGNNNNTMRHIKLTREADAILIAPASADLLAKMAQGQANDLASTTLLASDKTALIAPAMNHRMWLNPATQRNIETLKQDGHSFIGPVEGDMACGEHGPGRMSEPEDIAAALHDFFLSNSHSSSNPSLRGAQRRGNPEPYTQDSGLLRSARNDAEKPLQNKKAIVTSGPTYEPLDPVRYIGNRSSGKQGHAIAQALHQAGAEVTLITGPVALPDPPGVTVLHVEQASEMLQACENALPADIAICAAAVSDWGPAELQDHKIKKRENKQPPAIALKENPDILRALSTHKNRPALVIGFAAETENLLENAAAKRQRKGCDWLLANDVKREKVFSADENHVYLLKGDTDPQDWPRSSKQDIAQRLTREIARHFENESESETKTERETNDNKSQQNNAPIAAK